MQKRGEVLETYYSVKAKIVVDERVIARGREKLGKFVLATNDLRLTADEIRHITRFGVRLKRGFSFFER